MDAPPLGSASSWALSVVYVRALIVLIRLEQDILYPPVTFIFHSISNVSEGIIPIPTFPPENEKLETRVSKSKTPSIIRFQELAVSPDQVPTLSESESPPLRAQYQIERIRTVRKKVNPE